MHESTTQQAQRRVDDIQAFNRELQRLNEADIIALSLDQSERLQGYQEQLLAEYQTRFNVDRDSRSQRLSLGMRIASLAGALALAASLFFLFYQFWGFFSEKLQIGILITASISSLVITIYLGGIDRYGYFTRLAAMLAFACMVLNSLMLGDIFNITPSENALLIWAAYALLLAYGCNARLLLSAGLICTLCYLSARFGTWSGSYWLSFGDRPEYFIPAGLLIFLGPLLISQARYDGFAALYRIFGMLAVLLSMLILSNWGNVSVLPWSNEQVEFFYQLICFASSALFIWIGTLRNWPDTVNTGLVFFVIFLYTKFFDWWWDWLPKYLFFLLLGLFAVLILTILHRLHRTHGLLGGSRP